MKIGISIIVCCYNSAQRLQRTLESIAQLNVPANVCAELIIVDNNSSDNTSEVAADCWKASSNESIPFYIHNESTQGLSAARRKGVAESTHEYLLFCDDDNWLEKNYLVYTAQMVQANSDLGILGGRSEAVFEKAPPEWFKLVAAKYAVGDRSAKKEYKWIAGAGMVVKKEIFQKMNDLNYDFLLSDRKGSALSTGGDHELCFMARMMGYKIMYDPRLFFSHYMPAGRLTWEYYKRMEKGRIESQVVLDMYEILLAAKNTGSKTNFQKCYWRIFLKNLTALKQLIFKQAGQQAKLKKQLSNLKVQYNLAKAWDMLFEAPVMKFQYKQIEAFINRVHH